MMLRFFEGPAGTGKTTRVFQELERTLVVHPLSEHQRVLALTKMHGSRRRMEGRLAGVSGLHRRYHCSTVDSFAWSVVRRWRALARRRNAPEHAEGDYERVCALAGILLSEETVTRWVTRAFPVIVVDELQDSTGGQLEMIRALSASAICIAAADDFQDLNAAEENSAVAWAREVGHVENLTFVHRTSESGLLAAGKALRKGFDVPPKDHGLTVLGALNHNVGAGYVANNLTWWSGCGDIAVLTPVRPASSNFVRKLIARVEEKPISDPPVGPHRISWEESQEEECEDFIHGIGLSDDLAVDVCAADLSLSGASGPIQGLRDWLDRQKRIAGRTTFTAQEVFLEARRIHQRSMAHRRLREGGVRAMTIHQAKNREFHSVIVLWPYEVVGSAERQRRLLYNAITRAKSRALVVVQNPRRLGQPPFVKGL